MKDYDSFVFNARHRLTDELVKAQSGGDMISVGQAVDDLNKAWSDLADCLNRRIAERDVVIQRLLNELAEERK